jgi:hypothetical protein
MLLDDRVIIQQITDLQEPPAVLFEFLLLIGGVGGLGVLCYLEEDFLESGDADSVGPDAQDVEGPVELREEVFELGRGF